jgi:tetratricopeptide (TPR) repeat protein
MEAAEPGKIIVTGRIYASLKNQFDFYNLAPLNVKGIKGPITVYGINPIQEGTGQSITTIKKEMIGRTAEKEILVHGLEALKENNKTAVYAIEGEAGIGKSLLINELLKHSELLGIPYLRGAGDAIEKKSANHAWRPLFTSLLGEDLTSYSKENRRAAITDFITRELPEWEENLPLLNAVMPLGFTENELTRNMRGEKKVSKTNEMLKEILSWKVSQTPYLLILEDLHWFDYASWALLRKMISELSDFMIVITMRPLPDDLTDEYFKLEQLTEIGNIKLSSLRSDEITAMVRQIFEVPDIPDELRNLLLSKASGHPFFSEELVYALRDIGTLTKQDGLLTLDSEKLNNLWFPDSIENVITSRIDSLTPGEQFTLKIASVIGRTFSYRILSAVHPQQQNHEKLKTQLATLERLGIIITNNQDPELSYSFKHIITQEVTYNLMSFSQKRELHVSIAKWLETTYQEDLSPYLSLLAHHWHQALDDRFEDEITGEKTVEYLEKAAQQTLDRNSNREAIEYYTELLSVTKKLGIKKTHFERALWQRRMGEANSRMGNWQEARIQIKRALALMNHPVPSNKVWMLIQLSIQMTIQVFRRTLGIKKISQKKRIRKEIEKNIESSLAFREMCYLDFFTEELFEFLYVAFTNGNLSEQLDTVPEKLMAYANLALTLGSTPMIGLASKYSDLCFELKDKCSSPTSVSVAFHTLSVNAINSGNWSQSLELLHEVKRLSLILGLYRQEMENTGLLAVVQRFRGQFSDSKTTFLSVYESAKKQLDYQSQIWGLLGQAEATLWLDTDLEEASNQIEQAQKLLKNRNLGLPEYVRTHGDLARLHLWQKEYNQAFREAEQALLLQKKSQFFINYAYEGISAPAEVFLSLSELLPPLEDIDPKQLRYRTSEAVKIGRPSALNFQGRYYWLKGYKNKAQKSWKKAILAAKKLGIPHEEGIAYFELGRHCIADSQKRTIILEQALELFSKIKLAPYCQRTEEALR